MFSNCISPHSHGVGSTWSAPTGHGGGGWGEPELKHCPSRGRPSPRSERDFGTQKNRTTAEEVGPGARVPPAPRTRGRDALTKSAVPAEGATCGTSGDRRALAPGARRARIRAGGTPRGPRSGLLVAASRPLSYLLGARSGRGSGRGSVAGRGSGRRSHLQRLLAARSASALTLARGDQASAGTARGAGRAWGPGRGSQRSPRLP